MLNSETFEHTQSRKEKLCYNSNFLVKLHSPHSMRNHHVVFEENLVAGLKCSTGSNSPLNFPLSSRAPDSSREKNSLIETKL